VIHKRSVYRVLGDQPGICRYQRSVVSGYQSVAGMTKERRLYIKGRCSRKERHRHNSAWKCCVSRVVLDCIIVRRSVLYNCVCVDVERKMEEKKKTS